MSGVGEAGSGVFILVGAVSRSGKAVRVWAMPAATVAWVSTVGARAVCVPPTPEEIVAWRSGVAEVRLGSGLKSTSAAQASETSSRPAIAHTMKMNLVLGNIGVI